MRTKGSLPSSFHNVYHHKVRFGNCQDWNMQSLRCTHIVCTSMKRGLAMVKVWIMKRVICCWSSFDTAYHHKIPSGSCQGWNMQSLWFTHIFLNSERASNPSVNVMVLCIYWMLCLFTKVYATVWNALWPWLKYGLSTCFVFHCFSLVFDYFSSVGLHESFCGSRIFSKLAFSPRKFSCRMSMA